MTLDITKIEPEEALKLLGNNDWHIKHTLIDDHKLSLSTTWRQTFVEHVASLFVRWVIAGRIIEIHHDNDPPWDHSGSPRESTADPLLLLVKHETIGSWMENEHTGNSHASYVSGMGLFWDTYANNVQDFIQSQVYYLLENLFKETYSLPEEELAWEHPDWDEWSYIELYIQELLLIWVSAMSTKHVWSQYELPIRAQIEVEKRQYEEEHKILNEQWQLATQFWHQHFPDMIGKHIELPQFREWDIENRLKQALQDTDPKIVQAIARLGFPGIFSNSVKSTFKQIASEAMT